MALYNEKQTEQMLKELDSGRALICCDDHNFYPGSKLTMPMQIGCKSCALAQFWYEIAKLPPHLREERLEMLESLVNHMAEDLQRGQFNINVLDHPKIETVKEDDPRITLTDE